MYMRAQKHTHTKLYMMLAGAKVDTVCRTFSISNYLLGEKNK